MQRYFVVHYAELGLKKGNRDYFEEQLCRNIFAMVKTHGVTRKVRRISGRLLVEPDDGADYEAIANVLRNAFGVAFFAEAWGIPNDIESIEQGAWKLAEGRNFSSFAIDTSRSNKAFPLNSVQINTRVGAYVQTRSGARVDLGSPELTISIEVVERQALLYCDRRQGPGGLPANISGKIVVLLSGGIDSPVAAWKLMKRGCTAIFVHFHSFPYTNRESQEKVKKLAAVLAEFQLRSKLYLIAFSEVQQHIMTEAPMELRVILYRRYMMRLAERVALRERARLLATGDSLGQVASQTIANLDVVSRAVRIPILRPLSGDDKEDIVRLARRIGTFDISTLPDQDCCSLFVPKHPETNARLEDVERAETRIEADDAMERALASAEVLLEYAAYAPNPLHQL